MFPSPEPHHCDVRGRREACSVIFRSLLSKILPDWHDILKRIYAIKEKPAWLGG